MTIRVSTSVRNAMATAIQATVDADAGAAYFEIRSGSQPATPNTAATGTLLATIACADPAFGSPSTGVITLAGVPLSDTSADGTGTAGWFRLYDNSGDACVDGTVGTSGTDMIIDNASIVTGQTVSIVATSTITVPV